MMKWLQRWFIKKVDWAVENRYLVSEDRIEAVSAKISSGSSLRHGNEANAINFQVYGASGGFIVECSTYNEKTDRHNRSLHIITSDQDIGEGIAKIITIEMLRK
jgi:hypothetical protein